MKHTSEFRQNMATKEWVILAPDRGNRPSDIMGQLPEKKKLPEYDPDCPFCLGNEVHTEKPVYILPSSGKWQVRVVPNKFAALNSELKATRIKVGSFLMAKGFGIAEVVIEHPKHNLSPALMSDSEVANILKTYQHRQIEIGKNDEINLITIFRNHGARAGTSLTHPHSQIIATPIVPPHVRYPMEQANSYHDMYGQCVYCDMIREEIEQKVRIIEESDNFLAFCPFASKSPFECRIYPKRHMPSYILLKNEEIKELASILREILSKLYSGLGDPDYNYIIRSSPIGDEAARYMHWYMVIVPKITIPAGFEIGSGIYINTVTPEEAAQFLRDISL